MNALHEEMLTLVCHFCHTVASLAVVHVPESGRSGSVSGCPSRRSPSLPTLCVLGISLVTVTLTDTFSDLVFRYRINTWNLEKHFVQSERLGFLVSFSDVPSHLHT